MNEANGYLASDVAPRSAISTAAEQVNVDHSEQLHRQLTLLRAPDCFGFGHDCARAIREPFEQV
jgi:hypothetical protein